MLGDRLKLGALNLLPKNAVSRAVGALSDVPLPPGVRGVVNGTFATAAGIDLTESEGSPGDYRTLNAFFTRSLKDGRRPIATAGPGDLVSPCDGRISHFGALDPDTLVQAKGRTYTLVDLLDSGRDAKRFEGGSYATIYLSPRDYHRVHSPARGRVRRVSYIPGHLFPVNPFAVDNVDQLFAVNERLITFVDAEGLGDLAVVMVGATCVGRMSLSFHGVRTNQGFRRREELDLDDAGIVLEPGQELGRFNLGSTVILLLPPGAFDFASELSADAAVRMGQALGTGRS